MFSCKIKLKFENLRKKMNAVVNSFRLGLEIHAYAYCTYFALV